MDEHHSQPLLEVKDLYRYFEVGRSLPWSRFSLVKAVNGVSFSIQKGQTLGLVGESGCGKSTLARLVLQILEPTSGRIIFEGQDITGIKGKDWSHMRLRMQMIFQDPLGSLDPRMTIGQQLVEPLKAHGLGTDKRLRDQAESALAQVGLRSDSLEKYPHQLSGGMRQRVVAARALALSPSLLICDEPVSALDVSIQAQAVNLLQDLQRDHGLTYLFISHDLRVVRHISHRVAIMYLGRLVEIAPAETIFSAARHPYTRALISAVPLPDPANSRSREFLQGEPPSPIDKPPGCAFHPRCRFSQPLCRREEPELETIAGNHLAACHLAEQFDSQAREDYARHFASR